MLWLLLSCVNSFLHSFLSFLCKNRYNLSFSTSQFLSDLSRTHGAIFANFPFIISTYYRNDPTILVVALFTLWGGLFQTLLLYSQTRVILSNLTTNEMINQKRYRYLKREREDGEEGFIFHNPFDKGWKKNVREFLFVDGSQWREIFDWRKRETGLMEVV